MNKIIANFVHRPGVHSETTALRDVFEFHGLNLSEAMIFGLGGGLAFTYWHEKSIVFPFVSGRSNSLLEDVCRALGVEFRVSETGNAGRAWLALRDLIQRDRPTPIRVDMPYLRYLRVPVGTHTGHLHHMVVVAGIDEDKGMAYLADTGFEKIQLVPLSELQAARSSPTKIAPPNNRWYMFKPPARTALLPGAIAAAVARTSAAMLEGPLRTAGTKGIRHFGSMVLRWPEEFHAGVYAPNYEETAFALQGSDTGGGCFRLLYGRFLKEAGELLKDVELVSVAREYGDVGRLWSEAALEIRSIPGAAGMHGGQASRLLFQIADREEALQRELGVKARALLTAYSVKK